MGDEASDRQWRDALGIVLVQGDGLDLGYGLEFRSQLEIAYRFDNRSRLGVAVSHMSNASWVDVAVSSS